MDRKRITKHGNIVRRNKTYTYVKRREWDYIVFPRRRSEILLKKKDLVQEKKMQSKRVILGDDNNRL